MPAATDHWMLDSRRSQARCGGLDVSLDLDRPAAGLVITTGSQRASVDHLLGLDLSASCPPSDHWLRGSDITAIYEPADSRSLRATALWRLRACDAATAAWELIASAQTAILDSDPAVSVVADVAATDVRCLEATAPGSGWSALAPTATLPARTAAVLAIRPTGSAVLFAPHPDDATQVDASWDQSRLRLSCRLFTRKLEKGVLLRSRVLAACGPARDTAWADRLLADFFASAPPLST